MAGKISKILVVDDDGFVRDLLGMVLESEGFAVETAENGQEALRKLAADPAVGMVVTDLNMPVMGGIELIGGIRKGNQGIPIILLTGNEENPAAMTAGATECLVKDENVQDRILEVIQRIGASASLTKTT